MTNSTNETGPSASASRRKSGRLKKLSKLANCPAQARAASLANQTPTQTGPIRLYGWAKLSSIEKSNLMTVGDIFYASVGTEHVAHPVGEARILVIEKEGSV